ncbi:Uncharacterized protein FWK35_00027468, partial [Aphis craccivora]
FLYPNSFASQTTAVAQEFVDEHFESTEVQDISNNYYTIPSTSITAASTSKNSSRERPSPLEHKKYGNYKPMEWTIETLLDLIHTTNDGRYILADAKRNDGSLSDDSQNLLTQLLINHLFQDNSKGTDLFFRKIANLIVEIFPKEQKSVYFIPAKTEGLHQAHAKGKLIERWKNVARQDIHAAKQWLANDGLTASFEVVLCKWQYTLELRKNEILNPSSQCLTDIFKSWPVLQGPRRFELIIKDFELCYSDSHEQFKDWNCFLNNKYACNLLSVLDLAELNGNVKTTHALKLLLLPYLIPTKTLICNITQNRQNKSWKPSLLESASAFSYYCTNLIGLQEDIEKRRSKYSQQGATIQPYIIIVGKDYNSIDTCYIRVNEKLWSFGCPVKAFEVCFKSYFVFNCSYPKECYDPWIVIQQELFKLVTAYDRSTAMTTSVINKLKSRCSSINQLILHLKVYHNFNVNSIYTCNQGECVRDFQGSEKFRKHLMVVHFQNTETINLDTPLLEFTNNLNNKSSFEHESNHICSETNITSSATNTTSSASYNDIIINCVLEFITSLYTKPTVTEILIQQIIDGVSMLFSSELILHLKNKVMSILEVCSVSDKNEIISIIGLYSRKKNVSGIDRQIMVPVQGHLLPIKQNLKLFFELPGVYNTALKYTENSMKQKDILTSFLNGSTCKSIKCKFFDKIVFPIFLYYDDAEMGNPLGSHSGIHKMGCVYYTVPAFPPEYLSSLDNIFPAFLFHSSDRGSSKFDNKTIFASLIKVFIDLQENGISISVNSVNIQVYFVLGLMLGDNLGLNSVLGFVESFSANYYCRICKSHKSSLQKMLFESTECLRNAENYELDVLKDNVSETGIRELCVFNQIPNYHVTVNSVCDFMHDITEGVARYDMALIITHLIKDKYFTLKCLNNRIMLFEYGFSEKKNSPPATNQNNLNNGCIIMSSSEMLCLVRYFGLIVGELIPINTEKNST